MIRLKPTLKNYEWGIPTTDYCLASLFDDDNDLTRVAEAWWGSHPSGPTLTEEGEILTNVSYLLKIISVNKALSIQVHPDEENAQVLHRTSPDKYPDPYPKPEMAVALTEFKALCGFLPDKVIKANLIAFPEFAELAGGKNTPPDLAIYNVLTAPIENVKRNIKVLKRRIYFKRIHTQTEQIILDLIDQYADDRGIFAPLFMNYVCIEPGWALVIPPREIHAYLSGQAVECMAPSDNVVRAGLTAKYCDTQTLFSLVSIQHRTPIVLPPASLYSHPVIDTYFNMNVLHNDSLWLRKKNKVIVLVTEGNGFINTFPVKKGDSFLLTDTCMQVKGDDIMVIVVE
jgi:mannose-6-phosphate isomerase